MDFTVGPGAQPERGKAVAASETDLAYLAKMTSASEPFRSNCPSRSEAVG
jgi:hypothetical protein